jgi:hypothetical protein
MSIAVSDALRQELQPDVRVVVIAFAVRPRRAAVLTDNRGRRGLPQR